MPEIVIIGAGECGVRAAFALREEGFDGGVTLIGAEAVLPYERPPLSKGRTGGPKPIRPADAYSDAGIALKLGAEVARLDVDARTIYLKGGGHLVYDTLLLATGARARLFPQLKGCLTLRTERDAAAISQRLIRGARVGIIGGGFIGLELAATARGAGAEVTVVEAGPRLLARAVPEDIAGVVERKHRAERVDLRMSEAVVSATDTTILLANDTSLDFDVVIAGVGSVPNTALAEDAGLEVEDGIRVDAQFRTSVPNVFAAGDCCNFEWRGQRARLESWKAAQDQGAFVAKAMIGANDEEASYSSVPWFWSDQYDLTLQVAGLFDAARPIMKRDTKNEQSIVFQCDSQGRPTAAAGIGPGNSVAKDIRVFEKLIERGDPLDTGVLSDPAQSLKRLLRAA